ncbi:MAG: glycosyltransferase family 39 protein [Gloeobacterales cyanobacterium]
MLETKSWLADKDNQILILLLLGGVLVRAVIATFLYPGFDEAYYYLYTLHIDWSYFDHPPLVAFTTGLGPWLTGEVSQLTIRIGSLVLYTGTLTFLYFTSAQLFSKKVATWTLALATVIPIFQMCFGTLTLPDVPLMFFWSAALYMAAREFFHESQIYRPSYRLAIISLLVGLAFLGKYHGAILGAGLVGFCLTSPRHRSALFSPWTGLGITLFLVTISPVLFWNMSHDWASFRYQSGRVVPNKMFNFNEFSATFLMGSGYLFPTLGLPLWWVTLKSAGSQIVRIFNPKLIPAEQDISQKQRMILWVSLPIILWFTFIGGYQPVLPSWPMPGFFGATLLLGQQTAIWETKFPRRVRYWLQGSAILILSLMFFALAHVTWGIIQKPSQYALGGGFLPAKDDNSTQLIDIQQLRQGFIQSPVLRTALAKADFIFTNRFFLGGQIAMALEPLGQKMITCFDPDPRGFAFWSKDTQGLNQDALYISSELFEQGEDINVKYGSYFRSIQKIGTVPIRRGGEVVQVFNVYYAKKLLRPYPRPYGLKSSP